jgi:hypothetical protein
MMTAISTEQSTDSSWAFLNSPCFRFRKVLVDKHTIRRRGGGVPYTERFLSSLIGLISIFLRPMVTVQAVAKTPVISRSILGFECCRRHNQIHSDVDRGRVDRLSTPTMWPGAVVMMAMTWGRVVCCRRLQVQVQFRLRLDWRWWRRSLIVDSLTTTDRDKRRRRATAFFLCAASKEGSLEVFDGRRQFPCSRQGSSKDTPVPAANARAGQGRRGWIW